jgi:hypothetical protein
VVAASLLFSTSYCVWVLATAPRPDAAAREATLAPTLPTANI